MKDNLTYYDIFLFKKVRPLILFVFFSLIASAYLGQLLPEVVFSYQRAMSKAPNLLILSGTCFTYLLLFSGCVLLFS